MDRLLLITWRLRIYFGQSGWVHYPSVLGKPLQTAMTTHDIRRVVNPLDERYSTVYRGVVDARKAHTGTHVKPVHPPINSRKQRSDLAASHRLEAGCARIRATAQTLHAGLRVGPLVCPIRRCRGVRLNDGHPSLPQLVGMTAVSVATRHHNSFQVAGLRCHFCVCRWIDKTRSIAPVAGRLFPVRARLPMIGRVVLPLEPVTRLLREQVLGVLLQGLRDRLLLLDFL